MPRAADESKKGAGADEEGRAVVRIDAELSREHRGVIQAAMDSNLGGSAQRSIHLEVSLEPLWLSKISDLHHFISRHSLVSIDIIKMIEEVDEKRGDGTSIGPTLVRLAWHASGTYSAADGTGGSNGSHMRMSPEKGQ